MLVGIGVRESRMFIKGAVKIAGNYLCYLIVMSHKTKIQREVHK